MGKVIRQVYRTRFVVYLLCMARRRSCVLARGQSLLRYLFCYTRRKYAAFGYLYPESPMNQPWHIGLA